MFPYPGRMLRICTEPVSFIESQGLDVYRKEFNDIVTPELLVAEEYYKETNGHRITKEHVINFIRYWGIEYYITNCSPDSTYDSVVEDKDYSAAQFAFYCKDDEQNPPCIRSAWQMPDPYQRKLRDSKGILVPEPPNKRTDMEFDVDREYICKHGIVNYVIYSNIKIPMTTLLASYSIALWQRLYIDSL